MVIKVLCETLKMKRITNYNRNDNKYMRIIVNMKSDVGINIGIGKKHLFYKTKDKVVVGRGKWKIGNKAL